jgi:hypothetical protein
VADDVMRRAAETPQTVPVGQTLPARRESRADRARRLVYRSRFAVMYVLLAVISGAAVGALLVILDRGEPAEPAAWSEFAPVGSAERRAAQIGDRIGDSYRLPSGNPLAAVTYAGAPAIAGQDGGTLQVRAIAVETRAEAATADDFETYNAGSSMMYILCGLGQSCSIREGQPSVERGALLRREALELSLYTFKYVDSVDSVLVLLPPSAGGDAVSLFLDRDDVRAALDQPLRQTLTAPTTPGVGEMSAAETALVARLTQSRLYTFRPIQAQDGSLLMALTPAISQ